jgi:hypothetical protein
MAYQLLQRRGPAGEAVDHRVIVEQRRVLIIEFLELRRHQRQVQDDAGRPAAQPLGNRAILEPPARAVRGGRNGHRPPVGDDPGQKDDDRDGVETRADTLHHD